MSDDRHEAPCPVDQCGGTIRIPRALRAGEYACVCRHRLLALSWTTYADYSRQPSLRDTGKQPQQED